MSTPSPSYLISKVADPIFALSIGTFAALVRIRREEVEKLLNSAAFNGDHSAAAKQIGFGHVFGLGARRVRRWWAGDFSGL